MAERLGRSKYDLRTTPKALFALALPTDLVR